MAETKPPVVLELIWEHDLVLAGTSGEIQMTLDSAAVAGPSPMQALAFGLAGCMAMDLLHILKKGRHDFKGLRADLTGARADTSRAGSPASSCTTRSPATSRTKWCSAAIDLSRDKYCSVWHSMRQDIDFAITFKVSPGV